MKLAVLALAAWVLLCVDASAETRLVGPGGNPAWLRDAIAAAADGDIIELLPGEYRGEVAVIPPRKLTLRGIGKERSVLVANGKIAEGKAILVMRGGELTVENIEFRGARAPDANGAGIRFESGHLTLLRSGFFDNEVGLLTGNDGKAELDIVDSVFGDAPQVVGGLPHLLYVGRIARVAIRGSRFQHGFEGHLIKSRARETRITYNLIYDGPGGEASYEIDLPQGGLAWIVGNVIGQASGSQNPVVVAYGSEGRHWERNALYMAHNTLLNDKALPAWYLRAFRDRLPDDTEVHAVNNLSVGLGVFSFGASGHFDGNYPTIGSSLIDPASWDFGLVWYSRLRGRGVDPRQFGGQDLSPTAEFTLPVGTRPLPALTSWSPGAFQR